MKIKALGVNARVVFDGARVEIERRSGGWDGPAPALTFYPIEKVLGMQVARPVRDSPRGQSTGTFTLLVDPRDPDLYTPLTVQYGYEFLRDFDRLIEAVEDALRRLGRPAYMPPAVSVPAYPGAYTHTAPPTAPSPAAPAAPAHPAVAVADLAGQIAALARLREAGSLTAAEFAAAKMKLLGMAEPYDAVG